MYVSFIFSNTLKNESYLHGEFAKKYAAQGLINCIFLYWISFDNRLLSIDSSLYKFF
jgi:hypothetical protein